MRERNALDVVLKILTAFGRRRKTMENKCDECGKKSKVCYLSNNKRYKLYICRECKSKEENETSIINKPSCDVHIANSEEDK